MSYVELLVKQEEKRRENAMFADVTYESAERPDYNPKVRRHALDDLLEYMKGDIEMLSDYGKSILPEKQQIARDYDGLLATLRTYVEMLEKDRFEANYEYHKDESYWDSLD